MPLLAFFARAFLMRRLADRLAGRGRSRSSRARRGRRDGFGFFGPVPTYSRRTRGGGRVSVGGCCLPIPLTLGVLLAAAVHATLGRR